MKEKAKKINKEVKGYLIAVGEVSIVLAVVYLAYKLGVPRLALEQVGAVLALQLAAVLAVIFVRKGVGDN